MTTDLSTKLSEHFTLGELCRSDYAERMGIDNTPPPAIQERLKLVCEHILEPPRQHFGKPFRPSSGFRNRAVNLGIGSSMRSDHPEGRCADFEIPGVDNLVLAHWLVDNLPDYDQIILEFYKEGVPNSGWVHGGYRTPETNRREVWWARRVMKHGKLKTEYVKGLPPLPTEEPSSPLPGVPW